MCPWPEKARLLPQGDMDTALFEKIIDELGRHQEVEKIMPYLMNDPLIDPRIVDFINLARAKNPQVEMWLLTNGVLLNDDLIERLISSGLSWIGFSIHAIRPETYKQVTGRGDFEKIRDNVTRLIQRAREAGKHPRYVMVNITRMRPWVSDEETEEAVKYWTDAGAIVDYVNGYISRAGNVDVWGQDRISRPRLKGCNTVWAYRMVHILYNGDVVPCCMDWGREAVLGNLHDQTIEEIWHGEKRQRFNELIHSGQLLPPGFVCSRCEDGVPADEVVDLTGNDMGEDEIFSACEEIPVAASIQERPNPLEPRVRSASERVRALNDRIAGLLDRQKEFLSRF